MLRFPVSARSMFGRLPALARFLLALVAIDLAVFAAFRLVFWAVFHSASADAPRADVLTALYLGLKFDLRLALILCLPLALLGWIPLLHPARRAARIAWLAYLGAAQAVVILLYFVDFGHYDYVRARLNAGLADQLTPVAVAAGMVWETYPVLWGLLCLSLLTYGYVWIVRRVAGLALAPAAEPLVKWPRRAAVAALAALYLLGIYGKWSWYPLRWSDAYFSSSEAVAALALNPVLFLTDTKAGVFGNRLDATPHFDAIARKGILFTDFFVPETPSARSVFTMVTGIPDVNPNRSASRNPLVVNQHTLINALAGYEKYYFLGGSATWANIRGLLAHNIPGLHVFEEGDYEAPHEDVWGVSDLVLFEKAHEALSKEKKPFFAFIQTSGNHRPYTIPKDRRGFELAEVDAAALKENGFDNLDAYNGLRFLDYSLESFFAQARRAPYFQNTVFVMYGDHGNPSPNATPWEKLRLTGYHVPLVIYAPGLIKQGRRIDFAASETDSLPTYLSLIGVPYLNTGLGRDLLNLGPEDPHFSLIGTDGVLDDEFFLRLDPGGAHLYRYRSQAADEDVHERFPEKVAELRRLHEALYETSKYLLYHNPGRANAPEAAAVRQAAAR